MGKKKNLPNGALLRVRFSDGSGVCGPFASAKEAVQHGSALGRGSVVTVEVAETDEVIWSGEVEAE